MKNLIHAIVPLAIIGVVGLSCGDVPQYAEPSRWHEVATLPGVFFEVRSVYAFNVDYVMVAGADCTAAGMPRAAVYEYRNGDIDRVFLSEYNDSRFYVSRFAAGLNWFAGDKETGAGAYRPYVVTSDFFSWEELSVPASIAESSFYDVYGVRPDCVWFEGGSGIYLYTRPAWRKVFDLNNYEGGDLTVTENGRAFLLVYTLGAPGWKMYVSDDEGASWAPEDIPRTYGVYSVKESDYPPLGPAGEGLYMATRFTVPGDRFNPYAGILKRNDAPAGEGTYSLAFIAPHGPNFYSIRTLVFRSPDDGYALGPMTSAALKDGAWTLEQMPDMMPSFAAAAASDDYYWAVMEDANGYPNGLWRTP